MRIIRTAIFRKWTDKLKDKKALATITVRLSRIATGHFGDVKYLGDDVSEMRIHYGPGYRVYYTQRGEDIIFLLAGGTKSSQARDIRKAKNMVKDL